MGVEKKLKKLLISVITTVSVLMGFIYFGSNQDASANHFTTIPKVLWGTWVTPSKNHEEQLIKMTKYTFYVENYKNGKKEGGPINVSGKKLLPATHDYQLAASKHANRHGYWSVGCNDSDGVWYLKPTIHNGKKTLKSAELNIGSSPKYLISYYYKK
jgi:hypothetical protein